MEITYQNKWPVHTESSRSGPNHYEQVLQFVTGNKYQEELDIDAIQRQMDGYSNSLLLYEIRSGIQLIMADRWRQVVHWDCAWLY